ncbi:Acyl-CoA synthetase (AMP-forming)/AMP-acid ligase II [Quadrisphaera sp. DSM 44207]|nr:Acyl-CoA synthetase (AMP-forming)/AMP-acid ligase II [Quadrisphaera sp. DSM 44207]
MVGAGAAVLPAVLDAVRGGGWAAVADPGWPAPLLARAREHLAAAQEEGRLRGGDLVLFTSGSTGRPRGVVRTAASWDASTDALSALTGIGADDVVWLPGPLSSSLFLHGAWHAAAAGAGAVAQPAPPERASALHAVPALLARAVAAAEGGALPRVRTAVVAGDALAPALRARAQALGWRVVEYYGAAELSFVAWREDGRAAMRPFPGVRVRARDGVLQVRSPYLSRGYLDPADDGPLRWSGPEDDGDDGSAWAGVGDLGEVTGDGGVLLRGRGGSAVTTGGHTVVVEEVERALAGADGVAEVAVVGVPSARLGAVVAAVVVPADRPGARLREALARAARALPRPARPVRWHAAEALPRTAAGKVDRAALAQAVRAGALPRLGR